MLSYCKVEVVIRHVRGADVASKMIGVHGICRKKIKSQPPLLWTDGVSCTERRQLVETCNFESETVDGGGKFWILHGPVETFEISAIRSENERLEEKSRASVAPIFLA
jgi:hypothetical protein